MPQGIRRVTRVRSHSVTRPSDMRAVPINMIIECQRFGLSPQKEQCQSDALRSVSVEPAVSWVGLCPCYWLSTRAAAGMLFYRRAVFSILRLSVKLRQDTTRSNLEIFVCTRFVSQIWPDVFESSHFVDDQLFLQIQFHLNNAALPCLRDTFQRCCYRQRQQSFRISSYPQLAASRSQASCKALVC